MLIYSCPLPLCLTQHHFSIPGSVPCMMLLCVPTDNICFAVDIIACVSVQVCSTVHLWRSEDIIFVKSLHIYVDPGAQTQVIRFI